jgi:hypothetical protein
VRVLLVCAFAGFCWAQAPEPPKPVFPDDSQDPKQAGGAELLEAVCPGHVVVGKEIRCNIPCPKGTGFANDTLDGWDLARVTRGHFLSPASDDVVLAMGGCEPHSENFGGTILLTRRSQKWTMLWYRAGVPTEHCHSVQRPDGREILVCIGNYGGQGNVWAALYIEDLLSPNATLMAGDAGVFFEVSDNVLTCGANFRDESKPFPLQRHYIERVDFSTRPDGSIRGLSVRARKGERSMTPAEVQACFDERNPKRPHKGIDFSPPTKPYRVDFTFDGRTFKRVTGVEPSK